VSATALSGEKCITVQLEVRIYFTVTTLVMDSTSENTTYQNSNILKSTITEAFLQMPCQFFNKLST